ncbi:hypothetical protein ILYODFUR_024770, partial [Ilyodon furcidens]
AGQENGCFSIILWLELDSSLSGINVPGFSSLFWYKCRCRNLTVSKMTEGRRCQVHLLDDRKLELLVQ